MNRQTVALPILASVVGFLVVYLSQYTIPAHLAPYFSVALLAGLDTLCGGVRSGLEGKFHNDVFLSGFLLNAVIAGSLTYLGDRMGLDLYQAALLVMGWRIFTNLSLIRRHALTQWQLARDKKDT